MQSISSSNIVLGGKTYNPSQINSVEVGTVPRHNGLLFAFFLLGVPGLFLVMIHPIVWVLGTLAAIFFFAKLAGEKDWAVFFDMSSGKVAAFTSSEKSKAVALKNDIVSSLR